MKKNFLFLLSALFVTALSAQTSAEIEMAKQFARQAGYSESEINSMVAKQTGSGSAAKSAGEPAQSTVVVTRTAAPEVEQAVVEAKIEESIPQAETVNDTVFGHAIFRNPDLNFIPSYNIPTPANYQLAAGDEIVIDIWGGTYTNYIFTISPEGSITIPNMGPVYLSGQTIESAETLLKQRLAQIYSGMDGDKPNTFMRVTLGKIRSFSITVSGDAQRPGTYTLPSLSTIYSALHLAGGPNNLGSIRDIKLYRNGKLFKTLDIYDFIVEGKLDDNVRLEDNDLIRIEPYKSHVSVLGPVRRPMTYELTDKETIRDLVAYAGGFAKSARTDKAHIVRTNGTGTESFDIESDKFAQFKLKDGDRVSFIEDMSRQLNLVTVNGDVWFPGQYALQKGMTKLSELLKIAGGTKETTFLERGYLVRLDSVRNPFAMSFSLENVLNGTEELELQNEDVVQIFSVEEMRNQFTVTTSGSLNNPHTFEYRPGMTLKDAILISGNFHDFAYMERGYIIRMDQDRYPVALSFVPKEIADGTSDLALEPEDRIIVSSIEEMRTQFSVRTVGELRNPHDIEYRDGLTLEDVILLSGDFLLSANQTHIEIARRNIKGAERATNSDTVAHVINVNWLDEPEKREMKLQPYDIVIVRKSPSFKQQKLVSIDGEVVYAGSYVIESNVVRLSDIVNRAGGFTRDAYIQGAYVMRTLSIDELNVIEEAANQGERLDSTIVTELENVRTYRIGIDVEKALKKPGSIDDMVLRDGDVIHVPLMNSVVTVRGLGVLTENTVVYRDDYKWKDYVKEAGGFNIRAAKRLAYIAKPNGTMATRRSKGGLKVIPGSEIVVPQKEHKEKRPMTSAEIISLSTSTVSLGTMIITLIDKLQ